MNEREMTPNSDIAFGIREALDDDGFGRFARRDFELIYDEVGNRRLRRVGRARSRTLGIGRSIVEPGGARTEFRYASGQVAKRMPNT